MRERKESVSIMCFVFLLPLSFCFFVPLKVPKVPAKEKQKAESRKKGERKKKRKKKKRKKLTLEFHFDENFHPIHYPSSQEIQLYQFYFHLTLIVPTWATMPSARLDASHQYHS